jgi:hypothetical protein
VDNNQQHRDKDGNQVGTSESKTSPLGNQYTEHRDSNGDLTGKSEERTDIQGNQYIQHRDKLNARSGRSEEKTDWTGSTYTQHYDKDGRRVGQSETKTDVLGNEFLLHRDKDGNTAGTSTGGSASTARPPLSTLNPLTSRLPRRILSRSSSDDGLGGIAFLVTLLIGLALLLTFLYLGLPIFAGYWLAKYTNKRWINPIEERHRWRWVILPVVFSSVALLVNELIASGIMAANCSEPQSLSCSNYLRRPAPTVFGLHTRFIQGNPAATPSPNNSPSPHTIPNTVPTLGQNTQNTQDGLPGSGASFGAISRSESTGKLTYAWNFNSQSAAESRAQQECGASDCRGILWFKNGYGAFAQANDGIWSANWGGTQIDAEQKAINSCEQSTRTPRTCVTKAVVSSKVGLLNSSKLPPVAPSWQPSCGSPPVSGGTWWPVLGPADALEAVRGRFCGDAYVKADGSMQTASFSNFDDATTFARRLSEASGYSFRVGEPKTYPSQAN